MPPVWVSHYKDIERLQSSWIKVFKKRATGGAISLSGFHYQFLITLHDTLVAWLSKPNFERDRPSIFTECLSDILDKSSDEIILVTQVKLTRRSDSLKDALTELWLIYDLATKITPNLSPYLRFRILSMKAELQNFESVISNWLPDEQDCSIDDIKLFREKVTVELFSDPEDEILALLASKFYATDPVGYLDRWLGKLLAAASKEEFIGFEDAAKSIWTDLESLKNSSPTISPNIYVWTSQDKVPESVIEGELLTGERPQVHHLRRGFFASRSELYSAIFDNVQKWIIDLINNQDKQLRLPIFWIGGRSGSGKSVALLHVLSLLYESGAGSIFWLGNKTELLRQAIPWSIKRGGRDHQVIIGIDDPYAPNTQNDDLVWKEALALLEVVRQRGDGLALPIIICCGPTEQAERMKMDLPEDVKINLFELPHENEQDLFQLRNWYVQRTKKLPPEVGNENVLLVQLFFEWETGQPIKEFALRFRNRIRESDSNGILENLITRMLCVNRLYAAYPYTAVEVQLTPNLQDTFHRMRKEHHIAQTINAYGLGLWLAHAHLSNVIYESWYPTDTNKAVRISHLLQVIEDCFEFGTTPSEKMAPLWSISDATFEATEKSPQVGRLDQETVIELLPAVYTKRTQDFNNRLSLQELPIWIKLRAVFSKVHLEPDPLDEAIKRIDVENLAERGLRLTCHKLLQYYKSFSDDKQSKIINSIIGLLAQAPDWHEWAPVAGDAYKQTKNPEIEKLIINWVTARPYSKLAARLILSVFKNNSLDPQVLSVVENLLPIVDADVVWGDIAIHLSEVSKQSTIPLPVLQWAENNYQQWGACYLLGILLRKRYPEAINWAFKWCENWHTERSANYVLEQLLDLERQNEKLRDYCLNWIAANHRVVKTGYIIEKMIKAFPIDKTVLSVGFQWLEENNPQTGGWSFVVNALYDINAFKLSDIVDQLIISKAPLTEFNYTQLNNHETLSKRDNKLVGSLLVNPFGWYYLSFALAKKQTLNDKVNALKKAVELNPDFAEAWRELSTTYNTLEQNILATQAINKAIESNPTDPNYFYFLGVNYFKAGNFKKAADALTEAIKQKPNFKLAQQRLKETLTLIEAIENKDLIPEGLNTEESKSFFKTGICSLESGEKFQAINSFRSAIETSANETEAIHSLLKILLYKAIVTFHNESYERTIILLEIIITFDPNNINALKFLSKSYNRMNRYQDSVIAAEQLTNLSQNSEEAWLMLGKRYETAGNIPDAIKALTKALELNVNYEPAQHLLNKLLRMNY
jgi:tetratricopeptide (TPR) repeat protein